MLGTSISRDHLATLHGRNLYLLSARAAAGLPFLGAAEVFHLSQLGTSQAGRYIGCFRNQVVSVFSGGLIDGSMALIQELLFSADASLERAHDGRSIQCPTNLDLRSAFWPCLFSFKFPPGTVLGHRKAHSFQQAKRWCMVVVVAIGITMTSTVVEEPSPALFWVFVHKQHSIHCNTHHSTKLSEALGCPWCRSFWQLHLQVTRTRDVWILGLAQTAGSSATTSTSTCSAALGGAIHQISGRMVSEGKHIGATHLWDVLVEAETAPGVFGAVCSDLQLAILHCNGPCGA